MSTATLKFESEDVQGVHVIHVNGPLDSATHDQFKDYLDPFINQSNVRIVLDCRDLTYMNSRGVALLMHYHRVATVAFSYFALAELSPHIIKSIELLGLGKQLTWHPTLENALEAAAKI